MNKPDIPIGNGKTSKINALRTASVRLPCAHCDGIEAYEKEHIIWKKKYCENYFSLLSRISRRAKSSAH